MGGKKKSRGHLSGWRKGGGGKDMMHLMHTSIFRKQDFKGPYILLIAKKKAFPFKCSLKFTFYTLNFAESIFYSSTKCESTLYREEYKTKKERKALERVSCVIAHYTYPAFFPGLFPTSFLSHMTAPVGICVYYRAKKRNGQGTLKDFPRPRRRRTRLFKHKPMTSQSIFSPPKKKYRHR